MVNKLSGGTMNGSGSGLEARLDELTERVAQLEAAASLTWSAGGRGAHERVPGAGAEPERVRMARPRPFAAAPAVGERSRRLWPGLHGQSTGDARRPSRSLPERLGLDQQGGLEDLLGGRVLAWVGGAAVLLGLALL
ncbi:MAG TPA: hypothetical protein VI111_06550, partial [Thermoleophilaceae bacterium]